MQAAGCGGMADKNDQMNAQADEVIFRATYSALKLSVSMILAWVPFFLIFGGLAYDSMAKKEYWSLGLILFALGCGLYFLLDSMLFKELLFYQDRVVKIWYLLGQKTIHYSSASAAAPHWSHRGWLSGSPNSIFESKDNGKRVLFRLPIMYCTFFLHSYMAKKIEGIIDYLADDKESNPRKFKKSTLPREVVCTME